MAITLQHTVQQLKTSEPELRRLGIAHLSVFGSLVRGEARDDSDIDIAASPITPMEYRTERTTTGSFSKAARFIPWVSARISAIANKMSRKK